MVLSLTPLKIVGHIEFIGLTPYRVPFVKAATHHDPDEIALPYELSAQLPEFHIPVSPYALLFQSRPVLDSAILRTQQIHDARTDVNHLLSLYARKPTCPPTQPLSHQFATAPSSPLEKITEAQARATWSQSVQSTTILERRNPKDVNMAIARESDGREYLHRVFHTMKMTIMTIKVS